MPVSLSHSSILFGQGTRKNNRQTQSHTTDAPLDPAAQNEDSFTPQSSTHLETPANIPPKNLNDPIVRTQFIMDYMPIGARKNKELQRLIYSMNAEAIAANKAMEQVYQKHLGRYLPPHTQVDLSNDQHRDLLKDGYSRKREAGQKGFRTELQSLPEEIRHASRLADYLQTQDSTVRQAFDDATKALDIAANIAK